MLQVFALSILLASASQPISAKRAEPVSVAPVVQGNTRYVAPLNDGRRGYIEAWDINSNKKLWSVTVFRTRINPKMEADVQSIYIRTISLQDSALLITDELDRTYRLDLRTRRVSKAQSPLK